MLFHSGGIFASISVSGTKSARPAPISSIFVTQRRGRGKPISDRRSGGRRLVAGGSRGESRDLGVFYRGIAGRGRTFASRGRGRARSRSARAGVRVVRAVIIRDRQDGDPFSSGGAREPTANAKVYASTPLALRLRKARVNHLRLPAQKLLTASRASSILPAARPAVPPPLTPSEPGASP